MPREAFDAELLAISADVLRLGRHVRRATDESMEALRDADLARARALVEGERSVHRERWLLEERAVAAVAMQAPVAGDLRRLTSALSVVGELERIGDHAAGIAQVNLLLGATPPRRLGFLPSMADRALAMLDDALEAFEHDDVPRAEHVCHADDDLDRLQDRVYQDAFSAMVADPSQVQRLTYSLWVAHNLERVGDRCTNICERVIYTVTGRLADTSRSAY
ncbi:MAG: phosphate signaling complex protein PhoU [Dehalococcoidia bacterium]|nr:phosphate signaling complex protein PhoU [Dehalococcoidia bacterium]